MLDTKDKEDSTEKDVEMKDVSAPADEDVEDNSNKRQQPRRSTRGKTDTSNNENQASSSTAAKSPKKMKLNKSSPKREPIVYRWIGPGTPDPRTGSIVYTKLEMRVGGRAALIRTGDCALLCSGDVTEDVLYGGSSPTAAAAAEKEYDEKMAQQQKAREDQIAALPDNMKPTAEEDALYGPTNADAMEENEIYGAASSCFDDVAINRLDPFVARIERMWEDPPEDGPDAEQKRARDAKLLGKNYDERRSRMKIQARWFYKKEDIQGLTSHFVGVSRRELLATMTPRELILGDQADDNEVSTILGKCRVVRRPPLSRKEKDKDTAAVEEAAAANAPTSDEEDLPLGAYACRYGLTLHPPARAGAAGTVVFSPYDGEDPGIDAGDETGSTVGGGESIAAASAAAAAKHSREEDDENKSEPANKRRRTSDAGLTSDGGQSSLPDSRLASEFESGKQTASSSSSDEEEIANETDTGDKGPPATEGSQLHGSIHVGPNHQVNIPPLDKESAIRCRGPKLVWSPNAVSEEAVDDYLKKAADVLKAHMEKRGLEVAPSTSIDEFEKGIAISAPPKNADENNASAAAASNVPPRKPRVVFRECDVDMLLANLHDCKYDTEAALKSIKEAPDQYLTIWTKQQRELFNSGFRRYYGSLRMIGKGVGRSKGHKDVVDYFYRFKIPEQFCKYKDRKRQQAKRILQTVEKRKLRDALAEDGEDVRSTSPVSGSSAKRTRDLAKTAGASPSSIGQVEKRRIMARELLCVIRDTIGAQNYLKICKLLKAQQNRKQGSIPVLKDRAENLLGDHPELLDRFIAFLPKKHRN